MVGRGVKTAVGCAVADGATARVLAATGPALTEAAGDTFGVNVAGAPDAAHALSTKDKSIAGSGLGISTRLELTHITKGLPVSRPRMVLPRAGTIVPAMMGSPQAPPPQQDAALERASKLALLESPRWLRANNGALTRAFSLPRQAVSLLQFEW